MSNVGTTAAVVDAEAAAYDALIVGAGFAGIRALHEMRRLGFSVRLLEAGSDVGGTWYWNRYPGARTDSESWVYCFSFSDEIMKEWDWSDRMPAREHVAAYLRFTVDRLGMASDIQFDTRVKSAVYDNARNLWTMTAESGEQFSARYFVSAAGPLSVPYDPPFEGLSKFKGQWILSGRWPKEPVDFSGKRVGIVGAGASAVQMLPIIAETAKHVSLLQRTPNYVLPSRNYPLDEGQKMGIKQNYDAIWKLTRGQVFAFPIVSPGRVYEDVTDAEREAIFDAGWESGGFRFIFETFDDLLIDERSNEAAAAFVRKKIRALVKDKKTADLLCPDYPIAVKRPPLGNQYYEAFNRDNVSLIDLRSAPIVDVTETGIETRNDHHEFDILIFAMGFDAMTGALTKMDVRGVDDASLAERWKHGPKTSLGLMVDGFPNLFMISGPQTPFANFPPVIEGAAEWIGALVGRMRDSGYSRADARPEAVEAWGVTVKAILDATLLGKGLDVNTWFLGANIPGKTPSVLFYFGGAPGYFEELRNSIEKGFPEVRFDTVGASIQRPELAPA